MTKHQRPNTKMKRKVKPSRHALLCKLAGLEKELGHVRNIAAAERMKSGEFQEQAHKYRSEVDKLLREIGRCYDCLGGPPVSIFNRAIRPFAVLQRIENMAWDSGKLDAEEVWRLCSEARGGPEPSSWANRPMRK